MTRRRVADDQYGQLQRRLAEVSRRVDEGSIPFDDTMLRLQQVTENCTPKVFQLYPSSETVPELLMKGNYRCIGKGVEKYLSQFTFDTTELECFDLFQFRVEFVPFDPAMTTKKFLASAQQRGLKYLSPVYALRFAMCHPDVQRHYRLHFVPEQMPWIEASDMGIRHFSNFIAEKSGRRYLYLDGGIETGRHVSLSPLYDCETGKAYDENDWFGFRRDLPRT